MWKYLSVKLLRNKILSLVILGALTIFMVYRAFLIELSYEFAKVLPANDPAYIEYENFKKIFGEDGSVMVVGMADPNFFQLEKFNDWYALTNRIEKLEGVKSVLSIAKLNRIVLSDSSDELQYAPVITGEIKSQADLDSLQKEIFQLPFYEELFYNKENHSTLIAISFYQDYVNSKNRSKLIQTITDIAGEYSQKHDTRLHFSGMPYIRTELMQKVSKEMELFLLLGFIITGLILGAFFKSVKSVLISIVVVLISVIWCLGSISLLGYKITILSGLIPPLIMVIGVPNCIFLINNFHYEFNRHGNKVKALTRMLTNIGPLLFLANITTAIGFGVLYFTNSTFLSEFGVIAAINILITFLIAIVLIPLILYYSPSPKPKEMKHLEGKRINKVLDVIDHLVHNYRNTIYIFFGIVTVVSVIGMMKIDITGYVVDDLPESDPVYEDLRFFEKNFKGVLPFEILVNTGKPDGVFADNAKVIYSMRRLQKKLDQYPELSKSISVSDIIRFHYQGYRGGDAKYYVVPGIDELKKLNDHLPKTPQAKNDLKSMVDSTRQYARISLQVADIGSKKIKSLLDSIESEIDTIFHDTKSKVKVTGHSVTFLKGNDYLVKNLLESLLIEIILIAIVGLALFRSIRIILLSKLPCLIPLLLTAGIMGYFSIRFKPSTILIFSIAFGIATDGTIYFLTKYRQELKKKGARIPEAISNTIRETGLSMIYTAVILFFGFGIFAASSFGGIAILGTMISITLLVSMVTNIVLLPCILLSIDKWVSRKEIISETLIDIDEEKE